MRVQDVRVGTADRGPYGRLFVRSVRALTANEVARRSGALARLAWQQPVTSGALVRAGTRVSVGVDAFGRVG
jgi:hypothetical protein